VFTNIGDTAIYHGNLYGSWMGNTPQQYTLRHRFTERQDMSQQMYVQLPLYAGHYILSPLGIGYFLAGVQAGYAFWGKTSQKAVGTTTGLYERYVGIYEEMDNHGFRKDVPLERAGGPLKLKIDLMAHVEIGYEYNTRQGSKGYRTRPSDRLDGRLRIAGYADFGLLSIMPGTSGVIYDLPTATIYDFPTYGMDHIFASKDASSFWLRNISAGIRVTFLIGFQPKEHCILCDQWRR
jgi:hypothetical protein